MSSETALQKLEQKLPDWLFPAALIVIGLVLFFRSDLVRELLTNGNPANAPDFRLLGAFAVIVGGYVLAKRRKLV